MGHVQSKNNVNAGGDVSFSQKSERNIYKSKKNTQISIVIGVILIIIVAIFVISVISNNTTEKLIIGRWQLNGSNNLYEFTENGQFLYLSGSNDGATISYSINDDTLQLDISLLWANATVMADVEVTKNHLTLSNFIDPEGVFGVDSDDVWEFTREQ